MLPSAQIVSGYELGMNKLFTLSSPASLSETVVFVCGEHLCVCVRETREDVHREGWKPEIYLPSCLK